MVPLNVTLVNTEVEEPPLGESAKIFFCVSVPPLDISVSKPPVSAMVEPAVPPRSKLPLTRFKLPKVLPNIVELIPPIETVPSLTTVSTGDMEDPLLSCPRTLKFVDSVESCLSSIPTDGIEPLTTVRRLFLSWKPLSLAVVMLDAPSSPTYSPVDPAIAVRIAIVLPPVFCNKISLTEVAPDDSVMR